MRVAVTAACAAVMMLAAAAVSAQPVRIGIAQFGPHPQLDLVVSSFKQELAALGFAEGDEVRYDEEQVNFDASLIPQMVSRLKSADPRIILTITTPVSQGAKNALKGSDVVAVFAAVTDPVAAKLVPSWDGGDANMAGASDLQDIDAVLAFTRRLLPEAKRLGVPYNPGEDNDVAVRDLIREAAPKYGFEVVEVGVELASDVPVRIASFRNKADVIYVMASNLLQPAEPAIASAANAIGVPVVSANDSNVKEHNILASFAVNYAKVGANAAKVAARILSGEDPSALPVAVPTYEDHVAVISAKQLERHDISLDGGELADCDCVVD